VIILNFSRDILVDEEAVIAAIKEGKVRKYVTDFPNPTVAGQEGCIVIPHLGASTEESEDNCAKMAVKQLIDYLENGNIINSVNFPDVDLGICRQKGRVAIFHANIANMITQFTAFFGDQGINISDMVNKSKGEYGYTMLDIEAETTPDTIQKLEAIEGITRVRVVK
jgi:D-3-phosphoglycerate dehydrogenase